MRDYALAVWLMKLYWPTRVCKTWHLLQMVQGLWHQHLAPQHQMMGNYLLKANWWPSSRLIKQLLLTWFLLLLNITIHYAKFLTSQPRSKRRNSAIPFLHQTYLPLAEGWQEVGQKKAASTVSIIQDDAFFTGWPLQIHSTQGHSHSHNHSRRSCLQYSPTESLL